MCGLILLLAMMHLLLVANSNQIYLANRKKDNFGYSLLQQKYLQKQEIETQRISVNSLRVLLTIVNSTFFNMLM